MNRSQENLIPDDFSVLITEEQINNRLKELGKQISVDFKDKKPILIGVLNGGFIFLADLIRYIDIDLEIDFIRISSYGDQKTTTGHVKVLKPLSADISGRHVIIIEDIVDSGLSVKFLNNMMLAFNPAQLKFGTLLHKPAKTVANIKMDYVGFEIDDRYVVGYGLDDQQFKRNLRDIYVVSE